VMANSSLLESQRTPFALRTSIDGVGRTSAAVGRRKGIVLWAVAAAVTIAAVGSVALALRARSGPETSTSSASLVSPPPGTAATAALVQTNAAPAPPVNLEPPARTAPIETVEPIEEMDAAAAVPEARLGRPQRRPAAAAPAAAHAGSEPRPSKATPKTSGSSTTEPAAGAGAYDERL
jgi:hypothetical protein